ncbi:hypothetical protein FGIG_01658 [Fasciola gigantica]|uniref:Uncharacterized protein n=1 Tax=Fasciola gigantica TaxID=46835 RepID=A0A504YAJ9_FASGI|nr:hypothetical protein FGIG_01658 [Fasciola gigantica]
MFAENITDNINECFGLNHFSYIPVSAMTVTNETELNYASFCDDPDINSCLADEFSYQWMEDIEKVNIL